MGGMMPSRLTPFRQWCRDVGISVQTGYREVNRGRLVVVKVGRRTFVRESDSEEWMRSLETLAPRSTSRHTPAHTETQGDDERFETVGSGERSTDPEYQKRARAREGQSPRPEKRAPDRPDFDEVPDLPGCLRRSPALPVSPPAGQSGPTRGVLAREIDSATTGGVPTPTAQSAARWPTDAEIAEAYPTMGHASSPERDFVTALRDWRRDHRWVTPTRRVEEDYAPTPEDFMWPAKAAQFREVGDVFGLMAAEG